ncbi:peptidase inhibitor family I36 protein [Pseudoalteromonas sp. T1lg65]
MDLCLSFTDQCRSHYHCVWSEPNYSGSSYPQKLARFFIV